MSERYPPSNMQTNSALQKLTLGQSPMIATLEKLITDSEGIQKEHRRKTLDAVLLVADAWQILVRARKSEIAKAIDVVAKEVFLSCWNAIAVEVFMSRRLERRQVCTRDSGDEGRNAVSSSSPHDEYTTTAMPNPCSDGDRCEAINSAQWRIAQAWDVLHGLHKEGDGNTDVEAIRNLGTANFGENQFCAAMVEARVWRFKQAEQLWTGESIVVRAA